MGLRCPTLTCTTHTHSPPSMRPPFHPTARTHSHTRARDTYEGAGGATCGRQAGATHEPTLLGGEQCAVGGDGPRQCGGRSPPAPTQDVHRPPDHYSLVKTREACERAKGRTSPLPPPLRSEDELRSVSGGQADRCATGARAALASTRGTRFSTELVADGPSGQVGGRARRGRRGVCWPLQQQD